MAIGIPDSLTKNIQKLKKLGLLNERTLAKLYKQYIIARTTAKNSKYLLPNKARINAFKLLEINPSDIKEKTTIKLNNNNDIFSVKRGEWDKKTVEFKKTTTYKSLVQHFEEGLDWKKTEIYMEVVRAIENGETKWGCKTVEEYKQRCRNLDKLYKKIERDGFKPQKKINKDTDTIERRTSVIQANIDFFNEVRIMIGRNGELIHDGGTHRTCIAKILGLEKIPVIISLRHSEWQEKRNKAVEKPETLYEMFRDHPDIEYLID